MERTLRVHRDEVKTLENMATIPMDGRAVSLVYLAHLLHIEKNSRLAEPPQYITAAVLVSGEKRIDAGANAYIIKGDFDQNNPLDVIDKLL